MEERIVDIIERVAYFRNKKGISARKLSERIGKSYPYVHCLEQKQFEPSLNVILDIIDELEVSQEEFFANDYKSYKENKALLDFFGTLSATQKDAIMNLYKK